MGRSPSSKLVRRGFIAFGWCATVAVSLVAGRGLGRSESAKAVAVTESRLPVE
jgi:hypothetical protein